MTAKKHPVQPLVLILALHCILLMAHPVQAQTDEPAGTAAAPAPKQEAPAPEDEPPPAQDEAPVAQNEAPATQPPARAAELQTPAGELPAPAAPVLAETEPPTGVNETPAAQQSPEDSTPTEEPAADEGESETNDDPVEVTPKQLVDVQTLADKAAAAADALANLETEVTEIGKAADAILDGGDNASKLIASLTTAARETSNPKKTRILSIQSLADVVVATGQENSSYKGLSKRLKKVAKAAGERGPASIKDKEALDKLLDELGSGPFGDAQETVVNAEAQLKKLNGQIKRYDDWKKEFVETSPTPDEPKTLSDKIKKLGKDISGRDQDAASVLLAIVAAGYPSEDTLPSPTATRMSRVAFDAIVARPTNFVSLLQALFAGDPVDVVDLQRKSVHALTKISAEEARAIGTGSMIQGAFSGALDSTDRLTRILAADGVVAMVTAEEADKRSGLVSSIAELLDGETDVAVKSRLTRALQLIATDVQVTAEEESESVAEPVSRTGEVNS